MDAAFPQMIAMHTSSLFLALQNPTGVHVHPCNFSLCHHLHIVYSSIQHNPVSGHSFPWQHSFYITTFDRSGFTKSSGISSWNYCMITTPQCALILSFMYLHFYTMLAICMHFLSKPTLSLVSALGDLLLGKCMPKFNTCNNNDL